MATKQKKMTVTSELPIDKDTKRFHKFITEDKEEKLAVTSCYVRIGHIEAKATKVRVTVEVIEIGGQPV